MADLNRDGKQKIKQALLRKGLKLETYWKKEVPVYRGQYKASITTNVSEDGKKAVVGTNLDYAKNLEYELDQDFPDFGQLRTWVDRVINPEDEELDNITVLIGRKIATEGVETQAPLRTAVRKFKRSEA